MRSNSTRILIHFLLFFLLLSEQPVRTQGPRIGQRFAQNGTGTIRQRGLRCSLSDLQANSLQG